MVEKEFPPVKLIKNEENLGFAIDVDNPNSYFRILDKLPLGKRMSKKEVLKAKKYAYHFFFRRMIPIEFMEPTRGVSPFKIQLSGFQDLLPGRSKWLDVICDGILKGADFIYPAERIVKPKKEEMAL